MKMIYLLLFTLLLSACSSFENIKDEGLEKDIATVSNTTFDPIFSIKTKYTIIEKINGEKVSYKSSYQLPSGEYTLTVSCNYFETASLVLVGENTIQINLEKGHAYKLIPLPTKNKSSGNLSCYTRADDVTKS